MNELIFKTSIKAKLILYSLVTIIAIFVLIAFLDGATSWWTFAFPLLSCCLILYTIAFQKYTITDTSLQIKNGYGGSGSRCIPFSSITKLKRKKKGFQIHCISPNGKIQFFEIRYVGDWQQMLEELKHKTGVIAE